MTHSFLLVHSPLIGPYTWRRLSARMERMGWKTVIPSLLPVLDRSEAFSDAIARRVMQAVEETEVTEPLIAVGHSAAGAFLPVISSYLDGMVRGYVFLDARLPRRDASLADEDSPSEVILRQEMLEDGLLPRWSDWFGEGVMEEVLPDERVRKDFIAELKPIPIGLFDEKITFPSNWPDAPCCYVRLSKFYKPLALEASARGWPVKEIDAEHLHPLTHPEESMDLILNMVDQLER